MIWQQYVKIWVLLFPKQDPHGLSCLRYRRGMPGSETSRIRDLERLAETRVLAASGQARDVRIAAHLSQSEIAEACDVSPALVSRWESGDRVPRGNSGRIYARLILGLAENRHS